MVDFYGTEEHVIRIMKRPEMNACTDGLLGRQAASPRIRRISENSRKVCKGREGSDTGGSRLQDDEETGCDI